MPDKDGFPTADEIANGGKSNDTPKPKIVRPEDLNEDQAKAIAHILSGQPFVFLGASPRQNFGEHDSTAAAATGAAIFTAMHGDRDTLLGIKPAFPRLLDKLYARKGLF